MQEVFKNSSSLSLSIIIVSYNTADLTLQTLNSVLLNLSRDDLEETSEIIIVDNCSSDETVVQLRKLITAAKNNHPTPIQLITNSENLGFAKANNQAIELSQGRHILLLNSDTILQQDSLKCMINSFQQYSTDGLTARLSSHRHSLDHLGIQAAALLNKDGSIQPQGGSLPSLRALFTQMLFLDDLPILGQVLPTIQETGKAAKYKQLAQYSLTNNLIQKGWVAGTAMMIRRDVVQEIGMLDENIFMYGEDVEYCMRAKHKHWDIVINPQAKVMHLGSASSSSENAILGEIKGYLYIWAKHKPHWQRQFLKMILYFGILLRVVLHSVVLRDKTRARTYQKALTLLH